MKDLQTSIEETAFNIMVQDQIASIENINTLNYGN